MKNRLGKCEMKLVHFAMLYVPVIALFMGCQSSAETKSMKAGPVKVCYSSDAGFHEQLAAKEIRRYVYLRTGTLPAIQKTDSVPKSQDVIVIAKKGQPILKDIRLEGAESLGPGEYILKTIGRDGQKAVVICGGDSIGTLYGAYNFAEKLGVRFYLHGDVIPDEKVAFTLPNLDDRGIPLFKLRGIQPFHDFPEGPDWWSSDDYKAYFAQLPKMGMNFAGFHCYPESNVGPEPLVWIGLKGDVKDNGDVDFAHSTSWNNTAQTNEWGYSACKTSEYSAGAGLLFESDEYGHDVMKDYLPWPSSIEDNIAVFNNTGSLLEDVFGFARSLGIKTCIGTETPLTIPKAVKERIKSQGKDPNAPGIVKELYEGMFTRIKKRHPLDYYWLWTNEGWTWGGAKAKEINAVKNDMKIAYQAMKDVKAPFTMATCGWVLGPPGNRAGFDKLFAKEVALSCINRKVGKSPVEPGFAVIKGRPLWAIPWLEDDPAMIIPQLWVGRLRRDAADAFAYGCTGLMGIHWRTRILGPNIRALALAGWDQSGWNEEFGKQRTVIPQLERDVYVGGERASFPKNSIANTQDEAVYQRVRFNLKEYQIVVPDGSYNVTLQFCESHHDGPGKRVFGVKIQGKEYIDRLDVFEKVGKNVALDYTFENIKVNDEILKITFVPIVEFPCIAGIVIDGKRAATNQIPGVAFSRKINCGGKSYKQYEADLSPAGSFAKDKRPRDLSAEDFYRDWAFSQFGAEVFAEAAGIFNHLDSGIEGRNLPRPAGWKKGPGGILALKSSWEDDKHKYDFVDELKALRAKVKGPGNLERFDYWLNSFRYMRSMNELGCARGSLDKIVKTITALKDDSAKKELVVKEALPVRIEMARLWEDMMKWELARVTNSSEFGEIANIEQHNRLRLHFLDKHDGLLKENLGGSLPDEVNPKPAYDGPDRLIVPTRRTVINKGEGLNLKVIILSKNKPRKAVLYWRHPGEKKFGHKMSLKHIARCVYSVAISADKIGSRDIEYYIQAESGTGEKLVFPATAPEINQTVVVMPG